MHAVVRHSLVNLVAFGLSSLIGLAVVGLVVGEYGLAAFGLLMLSQVFSPSQLLALVDLGQPEMLMRSTARDLAAGQASRAAGLFFATLAVAGVIGCLVALPLVLASDWIGSTVLGLEPAEAAVLAPVLLAWGLAQPLLFAGELGEAALKGQERFARLRAIEVTTGLVYGLTALLLIQLGLPFVAVAYALLGLQVVRSILRLAMAFPGFGGATRGARPDFRHLWEQRRYRHAVIVQTYGIFLLEKAPSLVLSHLLGAAAVGLYESVLRVPRFLKSVVAIANGVVMPVVARLQATGARTEVAQLAEQGPRVLFALSSLVALPVLSLGEPLLRLWLGAEVAAYWPWFTALCGWPLVSATAGFWNSMGKAETKTLRRQTWVTFVQVLVLYAIALPLLGSLAAAAFWLAALVGLLLTIPLQLLINARRYRVPALSLAAPVLQVLVASLPAALLGFALARWLPPESWFGLIVAAGAVALLQALVLGLSVVRPAERRALLLRLRRLPQR